MRQSKYWDDFNERAEETVECLKDGFGQVPVRRVAIFITNRCQMKCKYCNHEGNRVSMTRECFEGIIDNYRKSAIIHITGGEPATVRWLYPFIRENGHKYRFHLNSNALVVPPSEGLQRLKVSLDSSNKEYWNALVGLNAFDTVVKNIQGAIPKTVVSVTYTMTKENYKRIPEFIDFYNEKFKGAYAVFFSVYKGENEEFAFDNNNIDEFFSVIKPKMDSMLDEESKALLNETIGEKFRIMQGVRFPENNSDKPCYLSLSERVFAPDGTESACSHLYRDGIMQSAGLKHEKCKYGCNRRLVAFNQYVERRI